VAEDYFSAEKLSKNTIPHLLFVGRLSVQKNLPLLIEAISHMQTNVVLDIVGEGELRGAIAALIQKYKLQNVHLHGQKTGKELIDFYRSADIFVSPSFKEAGVPNTILEALAAGLPVVASDLPEIRDCLAECSVLIQEPTARNYAIALDELLAHEEMLRHLSCVSIQKARSFSWNNLVASVENVYHKEMK
jgi:glycosyltransferase involved in cell wall biosynthesis